MIKTDNQSSIFYILIGRWQMQRSISNYGTIEGKAEFKKITADTLFYMEEGILTLESGVKLEAYREYVYRLQSGNINIYFAEYGRSDRMFHSLEFSPSSEDEQLLCATGHHLCGNDNYIAKYSFPEKDRFTLTYFVNGPKKKYVSNTIFNRIF